MDDKCLCKFSRTTIKEIEIILSEFIIFPEFSNEHFILNILYIFIHFNLPWTREHSLWAFSRKIHYIHPRPGKNYSYNNFTFIYLYLVNLPFCLYSAFFVHESHAFTTKSHATITKHLNGVNNFYRTKHFSLSQFLKI